MTIETVGHDRKAEEEVVGLPCVCHEDLLVRPQDLALLYVYVVGKLRCDPSQICAAVQDLPCFAQGMILQERQLP